MHTVKWKCWTCWTCWTIIYTVFCKFYIKQTPTEESYHSILLAMEDLSLTSTLCHNMRVEGHGTMDRLEKAPNIYIWPLPPLLHLSRVMDRCRAIGSWSHCKYLLISHSTSPLPPSSALMIMTQYYFVNIFRPTAAVVRR